MQRENFPQLRQGLVYLDSAATTLKPQCVIDEISHFYAEEYATVHRSVYATAAKAGMRYFQTRQAVQKLLKAVYPEEIIFTRGTTHSLNLLANSFCEAFLQKEEAVVISEIEHHSNVVPWQKAVARYGGKLLYVRVNDRGEIDLEDLSKILALNRVKLICVAHVSNITGSVQPVEKIIAMGHNASAYVALDGAQAIGHREVDVYSLDVDFYAFSSHKVYGPTGVGILYGKRALLEAMPPYEGGGDMIERVTQERSSYAPLPQKFEPGTPAIAEVIGFGRALQFIEECGIEKMMHHESALRRFAYEQLSLIGVHFVGHSESSLITFTIAGWHPLDVAFLLDCKGIALRSGHLCSQLAMARFGVQEVLRISFGLYTNESDIVQLITELKSLNFR